MNKSKMLSGDQLVAKGATKVDASLPETGLKDVVPNGSWLEQKQIQAALEARKQLIEVERIEKWGAISHAEWRDELKLAEVTKKVGSYWQYIGHNVGKQLFLNPEEALFLMEVNCLQLTYNEVTVSLQQAYSLLLYESISHIQYKVYAALSRLGYKVFRHQYSQPLDDEKKATLTTFTKETVEDDKTRSDVVTTNSENATQGLGTHSSNKININQEREISPEDTFSMPICSKAISPQDSSVNTCNKLQQLQRKKHITGRFLDPHKCFDNIPDLFKRDVVTIKVPEVQYLPENISLNKTTYVLNLNSLKLKTIRPPSADSRTYSITDEVNGAHVRRVRSSSANETLQNNQTPPFCSTSRYTRPNVHFRQFNFWRPRTNFNFYQFNLFFQRAFATNFYNLNPRFQFYPRTPLFIRQDPNLGNPNLNSADNNMPNDNRKRTRNNVQKCHLAAVKNLALRLKQLMIAGSIQEQNILSLQRLVQTYNTRYKTRLRLTEHFDLIEDETVVETIELDDDEEPKSKKRRPENSDKFNDNLNRLKQLALKLKELETTNKACSRHRRAFSNVIRTFNKSYNADIYVNSNYDILDRRFITLDSTSDSDCVIEETPKTQRSKKLRNPFSILKQLSEKQINSPTTSKRDSTKEVVTLKTVDFKYSEFTLKTFNGNWRPNENDFGRAEITPRSFMNTRLIDTHKEELLYDFMRNQLYIYENWLDLKISFWESLEETTRTFQSESSVENEDGLQSLIRLEDCIDMPSILNKLSIIQVNKEIACRTDLIIDFDIYNRDVQNFKKSNRPKPHFRIICIDESTKFPSGADIAKLHSQYEDHVTIVFAAVGVGSISYLQIKPTDLPVYIPCNDLS